MEQSAFNIVVPREHGALIYNTARGVLETLDDVAYQAYLACETTACESFPSRERVYHHLLDQGFLVSSRGEEAAERRQLFEIAKRDPSELALCIAPTYACNCACPYCSENYEKPLGVMSREVQDEIGTFVGALFERDAFRRLSVQWYGGEPMLAFEVVERLSKRLMTFCEENHVSYQADIITNATLVTPEKAKRLRELGVRHAMPTLDGTRRRHNARRPLKNGEDSYEATRRGIDALNAAGISVGVIMNCDRNNIADFEDLRRDLAERGISYTATLLKDYTASYECGAGVGAGAGAGAGVGGDAGAGPGALDVVGGGSDVAGDASALDGAGGGCDQAGCAGAPGAACSPRFAKPEFNLMPRDEFCTLQEELMRRSLAEVANAAADTQGAPTSANKASLTPTSASADAVRRFVLEMLRPAKIFCRGQLMNYFAIDSVGDVYKCDGWMGKHAYALFNLGDPYDVNRLDSAVAAFGGLDHPCREVDERATPLYNPYDDEQCKGCAVAPLCQGECAWDRELVGDSCHVLKDTAGYLLSHLL